MDLTSDEAAELENIYSGGLMRKVTPPHIEQQFLENGYVHRVVGGLLPTKTGHEALMNWKKGNAK